MKIKKLADNAVSEIDKSLPDSLSDAEKKAISDIVESTLLEAVGHTTESCREAAVICCGPEADLAHKISEEVSLAQKALIANLMGPR